MACQPTLGAVGAGREPSWAAAPKLSLADLWILYPAVLLGMPNGWRMAGIPLAPESLLLCVLLFAYVLGDCALGEGRKSVRAFRRIPRTAWLLPLTIGTAWAASTVPAALAGLLHVGLWAVTLFATVLFTADPTRFERVISLWRVLALAGAARFLLSPHLWSREMVHLMAWEHRTSFGYFLAFPVALCLQRVVRARSTPRPEVWLECALLVSALLLTKSRGPWLAAAAGAAMPVLVGSRRHGAVLCVAAALFGSALYATHSESELALRMRSTFDLDVASSSAYRLDLHQAALLSVDEVGLLGAGPGSAGGVLDRHTGEDYTALADAGSATDSDFVWLLVEAGPIAALSLLALLFCWGVQAYRVSRSEGASPGAGRVLGLFFVFLGMVSFDNVLSSPFGWFVLGIGISSIYAARSHRSGGAPSSAPLPGNSG